MRDVGGVSSQGARDWGTVAGWFQALLPRAEGFGWHQRAAECSAEELKAMIPALTREAQNSEWICRLLDLH